MLRNSRHNDINWAEEIKAYSKRKSELPWKETPRHKIVTEQEVKSRDYVFHPILQKYNNTRTEKTASRREEGSSLYALAKNDLRNMENESPYNIINNELKQSRYAQRAQYSRILNKPTTKHNYEKEGYYNSNNTMKSSKRSKYAKIRNRTDSSSPYYIRTRRETKINTISEEDRYEEAKIKERIQRNISEEPKGRRSKYLQIKSKNMNKVSPEAIKMLSKAIAGGMGKKHKEGKENIVITREYNETARLTPERDEEGRYMRNVYKAFESQPIQMEGDEYIDYDDPEFQTSKKRETYSPYKGKGTPVPKNYRKARTMMKDQDEEDDLNTFTAIRRLGVKHDIYESWGKKNHPPILENSPPLPTTIQVDRKCRKNAESEELKPTEEESKNRNPFTMRRKGGILYTIYDNRSASVADDPMLQAGSIYAREGSEEGDNNNGRFESRSLSPYSQVPQGREGEKYTYKRPAKLDLERFNPGKIVNSDIRFIDNGLLVTKLIEVKTPPPPIYEESDEEDLIHNYVDSNINEKNNPETGSKLFKFAAARSVEAVPLRSKANATAYRVNHQRIPDSKQGLVKLPFIGKYERTGEYELEEGTLGDNNLNKEKYYLNSVAKSHDKLALKATFPTYKSSKQQHKLMKGKSIGDVQSIKVPNNTIRIQEVREEPAKIRMKSVQFNMKNVRPIRTGGFVRINKLGQT